MSEIVYQRAILPSIKHWVFKGKVIILYGPRQVGKTTLSQHLIQQIDQANYLNCERDPVKDILASRKLAAIKQFLGDHKLIILDEAQYVPDIGLVLKLLIDTYPEIQIIATGSSSFDLSGQINEPLTGRNVKFHLYPLSLSELAQHHDQINLREKLEQFLRFGTYPGIIDLPETDTIKLLREITTDYLYKDVLKFENLKKPDLLDKLLKALALQIGSQVSYRELSNLLSTSAETIIRYLNLLEKSFVIFRLHTFSRNLRKELAKSQKIYFYDLGIRNALINNYNPMSLRNDVGGIWENFCIVEKIKYHENHQQPVNQYFWRTYDQKEIDYLEEAGGKLTAYEFKWHPQAKTKPPQEFLTTYPQSEFQVITPENIWQKFNPLDN